MTVRALPSGAIVVVPSADRALPDGTFIAVTAAAASFQAAWAVNANTIISTGAQAA